MEGVLPEVFGSYYFDGVSASLSEDERAVLRRIAQTGSAGDNAALVARLRNQDFIEPVGDGKYRLLIPLAQMWWVGH